MAIDNRTAPDVARAPSPPAAAPEQSATVTSLLSRRVLEVVRRPPSAGTVDLLKSLLAKAERGELSGLVVVALFPPHADKKYDLCLSGVASANPTLAAGAAGVCHMLLQEAALNDSGIA